MDLSCRYPDLSGGRAAAPSMTTPTDSLRVPATRLGDTSWSPADISPMGWAAWRNPAHRPCWLHGLVRGPFALPPIFHRSWPDRCGIAGRQVLLPVRP